MENTVSFTSTPASAAADIAAGYSAAVDNGVVSDAPLPASADVLATLEQITANQRSQALDVPGETPKDAVGFSSAAADALGDITRAAARVTSGDFDDAPPDVTTQDASLTARATPDEALNLIVSPLQRPGLSITDAMTSRDSVRVALPTDKFVSREKPAPGPVQVYDRTATPPNIGRAVTGGDMRPLPTARQATPLVSTPAMQHTNPVLTSVDAASGGGIAVLAQTRFKNATERVALPSRGKVANPGASAVPSQAARTLTAIATGIAPAKEERAALTFSTPKTMPVTR